MGQSSAIQGTGYQMKEQQETASVLKDLTIAIKMPSNMTILSQTARQGLTAYYSIQMFFPSQLAQQKLSTSFTSPMALSTRTGCCLAVNQLLMSSAMPSS
eukprot:3052421-Ditylum_brightwellii.AAC.1